MSAALDTTAAHTLLRQGETALAQGDRRTARIYLGLAEETTSLGALFAAQILSEALRPALRRTSHRRAA